MRYFPSASRSRLAAAVLACALGGGAAAVPLAHAADGDDLKKEQRQVERQVEHAEDDLEHSSTQVRRAHARLETAKSALAAAQGELGAVRARLATAQARDAEMRVKLAEAVARLEEARADLVAGQQAVSGQRERLVDRVTSIYQQGDTRLTALSSILDAQDPNDLVRRMQANTTMIAKEDGQLDQLRATEVLLRVRETQVEEAQQAVAEQQAAAAEHVVVMQGLHEEATAARARVVTLVADARVARSAAWDAQRRDREALQRLRQREQRIKQQILAAARRAARQAARQGSDRTVESSGFLSSPVPGAPVTSSFGYREHPIYHYWGMHDGTDYGAGCGTPLRAVASGTVMSSYFSSVYGNRLYLNVGRVNGRFLTAVYNHAIRYTVSPGQRVSRGEVVGYLGSTGWSTGCHLHFTLMANGSAVDPENWL